MTVPGNDTPVPPGTGSRTRLGTHIRVWMLGVGLVPLLVLFLYGYLAARDALIEASDEHLVSVVGARRAQIASWLQERLTDLEVIGRSRDCMALVQQAASHEDHDLVCHYLDSFQTGARDYKVLALFDLDWKWVASHTGEKALPDSLVDPEMRRALARGDGPVMSRIHDHSTMGTGFHIAGTLHHSGGNPVGYVVAALDLTGTFAPVLQDRAGLGRSGRILLADTDGRVLLAGPGDSAERLPAELLAAARNSSTGTLHLRMPSGRKVFAGFTAVPDQDWIVVALMDQKEALGLLYSLRRGFVVAGLLTLAAVIVLSSRSSRRLSAPLAELARAARRIKEGRRFERVPELPGREVAEVGHAFNEMLDALEEIQRQRIQAGTLAAVGELSSSVVHEIRNRLSSVKMNLQALGRRVSDDETFTELARIALEQVRRTEETLTDLLNYARPMEMDRQTVSVRGLLDSLASQFRAEASARSIRLRLESPVANGTVEVDRKLIEQALSNLIRNALESAPEGGCVTLRAGPVPERPAWAALEIADDGPGFDGIPPEDLFKPFFTTKERGAGLGLAHVRKIVDMHGGRVTARSPGAGGAVFRIELPSRDAERE